MRFALAFACLLLPACVTERQIDSDRIFERCAEMAQVTSRDRCYSAAINVANRERLEEAETASEASQDASEAETEAEVEQTSQETKEES